MAPMPGGRKGTPVQNGVDSTRDVGMAGMMDLRPRVVSARLLRMAEDPWSPAEHVFWQASREVLDYVQVRGSDPLIGRRRHAAN